MADRVEEVFVAVLAVDTQCRECGRQLLVHRLLRRSAGVAELCADQVRLQCNLLLSQAGGNPPGQ